MIENKVKIIASLWSRIFYGSTGARLESKQVCRNFFVDRAFLLIALDRRRLPHQNFEYKFTVMLIFIFLK
jgi:hypothetical protein